MDEEQLALVEEGLSLLIKKYKQNLEDGDTRRMKQTQDAKTAIRKVILAQAIKGRIKDIIPILENGKKAGWEVVDHNNKVIRYYT